MAHNDIDTYWETVTGAPETPRGISRVRLRMREWVEIVRRLEAVPDRPPIGDDDPTEVSAPSVLVRP